MKFHPEYILVGVDLVPFYLEGALAKGYSLGCIEDALNLPFERNSFDAVLATEIIEHFPDGKLEQMVSELNRVSNGYLVATVPNCDNMVVKIQHRFLFDRGYLEKLDWGFHHQRFTQETFEKTIEKARFNILSSRRILLGMHLLIIAEI